MFILVTHATCENGKFYEAPMRTLVEILIRQRREFLFVRHSMDGKVPSKLYRYVDGVVVSEEVILPVVRIAPLRYVAEIVATPFWFFRQAKNQDYVYIGADPLNAFSGVLLRTSRRVRKTVFYTADYSESRFGNSLLNNSYHAIDRFCVRRSDEVWNVSSRIVAVRKRQGLSDEKNIFVPNVPDIGEMPDVGVARNRFRLISLGKLGGQLDYPGIFDAIANLRERYPELRLAIVGNGPFEEDYRKIVTEKGISDQVDFLGYLSHDRALEEIARSGIGLALYNGEWSFNHFGDSMKCREYFVFGLPVITTDAHSTVEEIREGKAGIVVDMKVDAYQTAIESILESYDEYSRNSASLASKYTGIHERMLNLLESSKEHVH